MTKSNVWGSINPGQKNTARVWQSTLKGGFVVKTATFQGHLNPWKLCYWSNMNPTYQEVFRSFLSNFKESNWMSKGAMLSFLTWHNYVKFGFHHCLLYISLNSSHELQQIQIAFSVPISLFTIQIPKHYAWNV